MLRNTQGATLDRIGTQKKIEGLSGAASYTYMMLGGDGRTTCGVSKNRLGSGVPSSMSMKMWRCGSSRDDARHSKPEPNSKKSIADVWVKTGVKTVKTVQKSQNW